MFFWNGMFKDIKSWINKCHICKISKPSHLGGTTIGEYTQVNQNFQRVHLDIIGPLRKSFRGFKYLLVGIDAFSHWTFIKPLRRKDADIVSKAVDEELIIKGRLPETVVVDSGMEFNSQTFKNLCIDNNINIHFCAPYHHASNGLVERMNLQIENALKCLLAEKGGSWDKHIDKIELSINTTIHGTIGYSPHEAIYNKIFPVNLIGILNDSEFENENKDIMMKDIQRNIIKVKNKVLNERNKCKKYRKLNIGDEIYIKVHENNSKLKPIYKGPFCVVEKHCSGYSYYVKDENDIIIRVNINNVK